MPPSARPVARALQPDLPSQEFRDQFHHPAEVFSVLLILGGDVVARALAQLAGGRLTPVTFSFGWVAYAVSAVVSAVGENKIMPPPDTSCVLINGDSGYSRENTSWVLGRLLRDFDGWMHGQVKAHIIKMRAERIKFLEERDKKVLTPEAKPTIVSLCVSVYEAVGTPGSPKADWVWWTGIAAGVIQLGVAAIPCGIWGDWGVMMITAAGILLCLTTGSLSQWAHEKWPGRRDSKKDVILTRGNGSQHAIIIRGSGVGLDLEDLVAAGNNTEISTSAFTTGALIVLAALWILLLITAAGLSTHNWFLLLVGGIGIIQNILVAGFRRHPRAVGLPLEFVRVFGNSRGVMHTLYEVEKAYPGLGFCMTDIFFPGGVRKGEKHAWHTLNPRYFKDDLELVMASSPTPAADTPTLPMPTDAAFAGSVLANPASYPIT
ncbi:hypothetical protein Q7P35_008952 [Cladosporium inversicolor]